MIKEIKITNWKSFGETTLYLDPLTVLIGMNASGKSNLVDALDFLQKTIIAKDLRTALGGDQYIPAIRGGISKAVNQNMPSQTVDFRILLENKEAKEYIYELKLDISIIDIIGVFVRQEKLSVCTQKETILWETKRLKTRNAALQLIIEEEVRQKNFNNTITALKQMYENSENGFSEEMKKAVAFVAHELSQIFILEPAPQIARNYAQISPYLARNGGNAAGVIANLKPKQKKEIEKKLSEYAKLLPEKEIAEVRVRTAFEEDAMFFVEESFGKKNIGVDARSLSDGTLRFLIVLTAVLLRPKGSLLVIEEIDNGIYPSRAKLLLEILLKEGKNSGIDILLTTHNVAFLNELTPHLLPFVMLVHRDSEGNSMIKPVDESENLVYLLGQGYLGDILANPSLNQKLAG